MTNLANPRTPPVWRLTTFLAAGLSLAVGWGIRGNFGHEYGAGFAGCLAVMAVVILSGREDWRRRIVYFAFFGFLGWAFGGSMSYMQVLSYTHAGHAPTAFYGFLGVFYIGFLWAGLGGAGAALPAVADRDRLTNFFIPLLFVFGAWVVLHFLWDPLALWLQTVAQSAGAVPDGRWSRHESPLYWLDTDYHRALFALIGLCVFDWADRARRGFHPNLYLPPVFAAGGALAGWLVQKLMDVTGLLPHFTHWVTYYQANPDAINPETGQSFGAHDLLTNWPEWFADLPQHVGWVIGLILGVAAYFYLYGQFRRGASLFVYMACGWLLCFLALPVLGSNLLRIDLAEMALKPYPAFGGFRMTPPRSDDWAGITGVFLGMTLWMLRNRMPQVPLAAAIAGIAGGIGFTFIAWLQMLLRAFGNPAIASEDAVATWANWQAQNWHSFLEQSYGFMNGLAAALALAFLATRTESHEQPFRPRRWTEAFAAFFVLIGITYLNVVKNVAVWAEQLNPAIWTGTGDAGETVAALWKVPYLGHLPGLEWLAFTPTGWFNLTYALFAVAFLWLAYRHIRDPLAVVPRSNTGKAQMLYLILLWVMIIANFERALTGWAPNRILTEWVIIVNGVLCTLLVLLAAREGAEVVVAQPSSYKPVFKKVLGWGAAATACAILIFFGSLRLVYGGKHAGHYGDQYRFGEDATWLTKPNLKNQPHQ